MENIELSPLQDNKIKNTEKSQPTSAIDKDKMVIRRNGDTVYFDPQKISIAMTKATENPFNFWERDKKKMEEKRNADPNAGLTADC